MKKIQTNLYTIEKKISSSFRGKKSFLFISVFSILILLFSACKDENELGLNVLPPGDNLTTIFCDTSTLTTLIEQEDSLRGDEVSYQLIGSGTDPVFGRTTASVFTQVALEGTPSFTNMPEADSLVLVLKYTGYYGDTTLPQNFFVYRIINEDLRTDSAYYTSRVFAYDHTPLGSLSFTPKPNTKVLVGTDTVSSQLRIRLSDDLADSLILLSGQSAFASNANWLSYFKGLFIDASPVSGQGAISYFNFFQSSLTLYFHDTTGSGKAYDFSLAAARLNHFEHDYTGTPVGNQLTNPADGDSLNYLQTMGGIRTKISFPFLKHFLDSGSSILINRAELTISALPGTSPYTLPSQLLLVTRDAGGARAFPIDYYESSSYYGGIYSATTGNYVFNITRELQRYLNGTTTSAEFYLIPSAGSVDAKRAIIRSGKNATSPMRLSLYYTKLN